MIILSHFTPRQLKGSNIFKSHREVHIVRRVTTFVIHYIFLIEYHLEKDIQPEHQYKPLPSPQYHNYTYNQDAYPRFPPTCS
jgi:energy-converting hydrogenase Eha subunit F